MTRGHLRLGWVRGATQFALPWFVFFAINFGLAIIGDAQISALAQADKTITVPNVFDVADVDVKNVPALKAAADTFGAGGASTNNNADRSCYPPNIKFTILDPGGGDPAFAQVIFNNRRGNLQAALTQAGLDPSQFSIDSANAVGHDGDVRISANTEDRDPPRLKVTSVPRKGTKVKAGETITVTIRASERYEDGHKSRPTGVQIVQLISDTGGLVDSRQFGRPPDPCARQSVQMKPYLVKKPLPPVIHLHALAEDAVGHQSGDDGDFPTAGDWYGMLKAHGQGNVYNDTAEISFNFSEETDGAIKGTARAKMTSKPQPLGDCIQSHTRAPDQFDFPITGRHVGNEFRLELSGKVMATYRFTAKCHGHGSTSPPSVNSAFAGPGVALAFYRPKVKAEDGAKNTFHATVGPLEVNGSIELHRAKK